MLVEKQRKARENAGHQVTSSIRLVLVEKQRKARENAGHQVTFSIRLVLVEKKGRIFPERSQSEMEQKKVTPPYLRDLIENCSHDDHDLDSSSINYQVW